MQALPIDVLRYLGSVFLTDTQRLTLALVNRSMHNACRRDVDAVVFDTLLDVRGREGFQQSRNGYWYVPVPVPPPPDKQHPPHPYELGQLAATHPWEFARTWVRLPSSAKSFEFRRQCIRSLSLHVWHAEVLVAVKVLKAHRPRAPDRQLFRRAVWYGCKEVVCFLMDDDKMPVDADDGAALSLALSTLGHDRSEAQVADLVQELLKRGANPTRHNLWGIRVCLQLDYHVVASLMCTYAMNWDGGHHLLSSLVEELEEDENQEHAALVRASAKLFYLV